MSTNGNTQLKVMMEDLSLGEKMLKDLQLSPEFQHHVQELSARVSTCLSQPKSVLLAQLAMLNLE